MQKLTFTGPLTDLKQIKTARGSCSSTCTPSNTNDVEVVICCLGQNNCNNLFGYGGHHFGGHSSERGVNSMRKNKHQNRG
jgi:hypothetical protein